MEAPPLQQQQQPPPPPENHQHQQPAPPPQIPTPIPQEHKKGGIMTTLLQEATTLFQKTTSSKYQEDNYIVSNLKPSFQKSLHTLKLKLREHFNNSLHQEHQEPHCSMWGINLLSGSDQADVILLKFLRARDFNVPDALSMLTNSLSWRSAFKADSILEEEEEEEEESHFGLKKMEGTVAYMHGYDREGHPVCYNAYGVFKDKEVYERVFGDEEKLARFLRWRVRVMERGIKLLHFKPGGVNSIIQVTDLKDMPKRELRVVSNQILSLFQDNYPEMVARKIFINVPRYFSLLYAMVSPFLTQRTKSKFVICQDTNVAETLYKFIRPEDIPVQYGGLSRSTHLQNGPTKPASEFTVKGGEKVNIQIEGIEAGATIAWDIVVGGWDLVYSAEFVPNAEGSYSIAVEKPRKMKSSEEAVYNSYTSKESGKLVLSVDNTASRKKKVAAYRYVVRKSTMV